VGALRLPWMDPAGNDDCLLMIVVHDVLFHLGVVLVIPPAIEGTIAYRVVGVIYALEEVSIILIEAVTFFLEGGTKELPNLSLAL
jgi:hypothetical protein